MNRRSFLKGVGAVLVAVTTPLAFLPSPAGITATEVAIAADFRRYLRIRDEMERRLWCLWLSEWERGLYVIPPEFDRMESHGNED